MKTRKRLFSIIGVFFVSGFVAGAILVFSGVVQQKTTLVLVALADDDEEEYEDGEHDDEYEHEGGNNDTYEERIEYVTQEITHLETTVVLDEIYQTDTDGDGLVDGIDPDPNIHQREYFTDDDGDSIPNALDQYHSADDLTYFNDNDQNQNGILDLYEKLAFNS